MTPWSNELLIDVELLNLDSSSMRQIAEEAGGQADRVAARVREIVAARGKMHNPVTNSGGVLVGRVAAIGAEFPDRSLRVGERICPSISLSLIPLRLDAVHAVDIATTQLRVSGQAILFESGVYGRIPADFALSLAVGLIDVSGAPARVLRMAEPGATVAVLGAGKAGMLCAVAAREAVGPTGCVIVLERDPRACAALRALAVADVAIEIDLQDAIGAWHAIERATGGRLCDLAVSLTNVPHTEGAAILSTRQRGTVLLFGMANSFQAAALSAEGAGKDIELVIGNGYAEGAIGETFSLVRRHPDLRALLEQRFS
jgi:L-erythro-3,5-diaminohexanoate dehydrogenase